MKEDDEVLIQPFTPPFEKQVADLILSIQREEFHIQITLKDQPDLTSIPAVYQQGIGNFWIAVKSNVVCGTVGLSDIGNYEVALRKMFVSKDFRGHQGIAHSLIKELFDWCREKSVRKIYLGTVDILKAAHRFYEKNGFVRCSKEELPASFPLIHVDTIFYKYTFQ
ncbi:MAG TPA: GNAT family N-acetyltransferase [Flavitalea sp.]|nr:GNAT family N-acetyltransferase [Flavitalea sp.]